MPVLWKTIGCLWISIGFSRGRDACFPNRSGGVHGLFDPDLKVCMSLRIVFESDGTIAIGNTDSFFAASGCLRFMSCELAN